MSDILIKSMEMPTEDGRLCIDIYPDGKVCIALDLECKQVATAVPVPPHGRLIDADALCMKLKMMYAKAFGEGNTAYHAAYRSLERVVSHEPTIIPAEEE